MKIKFTGDTLNINEGLTLLSQELNYEEALDETYTYTIDFENRKGALDVEGDSKKAKIIYDQPIHAFRALSLLFEKLTSGEQTITLTETPQFQTTGAMLDASRNGVLKVEKVKFLLRKMALMGLNQLMVYTEDTYEVTELPYFGYMRGKYTKEEIMEIDAYADKLGIEMVPCIQALAHLSEALKWEYANDIKDTDDILYVGKDETYVFLEKLIKSISSAYKTEKIHIGMDEAHYLGLGSYLDENSHTHRFELMTQHLNELVKITEKYGLKPMMWSDMFFTVGSDKNIIYDPEAVFPESLKKDRVDVDLVYWNYYQSEKENYVTMFKRHKELTENVIFAGGIWTWNGIVPNYGKTWVASNAGLTAAKESGIKKVFATMWGDNGQETNLMTVLPGLQLFAEHTYNKEVTKERVKERFDFIVGTDINDFLLLSFLDETPGVSENNLNASMTSKVLLYQDVLMGLFDKNIGEADLETHYKELSKKLKQIGQDKTTFNSLFKFYHHLSAVLEKKATIGIKIKETYDLKDKEDMKHHLNTLQEISRRIEELRKAHRELWLETNKPVGWEILDIRYGGVLSRVDTAIYRLDQWLKNEVDTIAELEETKLPFKGPNGNPDDIIGNAMYHQIVSASPLSK